MKTLFLCLVCAAGCGPIPVAETDEAVTGVGTTGGVKTLPQTITLTVDSIEPAQPVENRPVYVHFTLNNQTRSAHDGYVQAEVETLGGPFGSSYWSVSLQAYSSTSGVLEFDAPYAGLALGVTPHFYDPYASAPIETSTTQLPLSPALRVSYRLNTITIASPADGFWGDSDVDYLTTTRNGSTVGYQSLGLGHLKAGVYPSALESPSVDLVPATSDRATFEYRVGRWPYAWGAQVSDVTMADWALTISGDSVQSFMEADDNASWRYEFYNSFCNGVPQTAPCAAGSYSVDSFLRRWRATEDTLPITYRAEQLRVNQLIELSYDATMTFVVPPGAGQIVYTNDGGVSYLAPPTVPSPPIVQIIASGNTPSGPKSEPIYIGISP